MNAPVLRWAPMLAVLIVITAAQGQSGGGYYLTWNTNDGGGETFSTGGTFSLAGTIGQADPRTEAMTGGDFSLVGGFWVIPACEFCPADFDEDCDVDLLGDFAIFEPCATGPRVPYNPAALGPSCVLLPDTDDYIGADFDKDGDVDVSDFAAFQRCHGNETNPPDPNCAD